MKPDLSFSAHIISRSGVYGWRRNGRYLYIGQSKRILNRIIHHHVINQKLVITSSDRIDVWFCSRDQLDKFEAALITKFNPPFNKRLPFELKNSPRPPYDTFKEAALSKVDQKKEHKKLTREEMIEKIKRENPEFDVDGFLARTPSN